MIRFAAGQGQETKCGEMDGKEPECPIAASKRGNGPARTPGAKGAPRVVDRTPEPRRGHRASPACYRSRWIVWGTAPQRGEPDGFDGHVRTCVGPGWATTQVYAAQGLPMTPEIAHGLFADSWPEFARCGFQATGEHLSALSAPRPAILEHCSATAGLPKQCDCADYEYLRTHADRRSVRDV
jgi:hypothetical protein